MSDPAELLKKVRKIEIKTRGLSSQIFSGEYHSAFKGKGMAFSEVREYIPGDDIRSIDWNVTARLNHPYVKIFEEERELTVILLVDISGSGSFGSTSQMKKDLVTELCAVIAFSAIQNNDKIGVILFSDKIEKFIPPKKGKSHILRIIRELINFQPTSNGTDIGSALKYFSNMIKRRAIVFVISDFIDEGFEDPLKIAARKHDLVALQAYDERETELPNIGLIRIKDAETGEMRIVDTSSKSARRAQHNWWIEKQNKLYEFFAKSGIDHVGLKTGQDYVKPLMGLFKKRERRA
ncbi:MAG: DUF58 domain-containing protein [Bacteroidia bacterium]|nr:DUF58 domain-containing protein [Bacteroidia bacterium]